MRAVCVDESGRIGTWKYAYKRHAAQSSGAGRRTTFILFDDARRQRNKCGAIDEQLTGRVAVN